MDQHTGRPEVKAVMDQLGHDADVASAMPESLLARYNAIAQRFAERTAPQLPEALQQPARDHASTALAVSLVVTALLALRTIPLLLLRPASGSPPAPVCLRHSVPHH